MDADALAVTGVRSAPTGSVRDARDARWAGAEIDPASSAEKTSLEDVRERRTRARGRAPKREAAAAETRRVRADGPVARPRREVTRPENRRRRGVRRDAR